jgi:hypothetical protein
MATLNQLGISMQEQTAILLGLQVQNFCHLDPPPSGSVEDGWVFGYDRSGAEIYIKVKIRELPGGELLICVSFHLADQSPSRRLIYPYK